MNKRLLQIAASFFLVVLLLPSAAMAAPGMGAEHTVRIGLAYDGGSVDALAAANLENSVGSGYAFGYFDTSANFCQVGTTAQSQLSMLKTQNLYLSGKTYTTTPTTSAVGCYHIQLPEEYADFAAAQLAASQQTNGFPAWIDGVYRVRVGAYTDKQAALDGQTQLALTDSTVVGTSSDAVSVVQTGTTQILFQFDGGGLGYHFAVQPNPQDAAGAVTWFKGWKYYGAFEYIRNGSGGNMTVINWVPMEQYVKGVVPYEIGASRPMEAMKAQAVCNRTYAAVQYNKHKHASKGFDLCNTTDCQVYHGAGSSTSYPTTDSNRACEETAGIYAWYDGNYAETYYYSSNGGASETVSNVWSGNGLAYLVGKADPYEALVEKEIPKYRWSYTLTSAELTAILNQRGYTGTVTEFYVSKFTDVGNVYSITFGCDNGKSYTFSKEKARTILGLARSSMRYTVSGSSGSGGGSYYANGGTTLSTLNGLYAIGGDGTVSQIPDGAYAITSSGTGALSASGATSSGVWTVTGSGWGHNVGMSQWGAISMARQGYTYEQILSFYYSGITLGAY